MTAYIFSIHEFFRKAPQQPRKANRNIKTPAASARYRLLSILETNSVNCDGNVELLPLMASFASPANSKNVSGFTKSHIDSANRPTPLYKLYTVRHIVEYTYSNQNI